MTNNKFYDVQTDLTASKILIYQQYLSHFLPRVLMQYGRCFIGDFFCGCGKNGENNGSPLVLLEVAKKTLESQTINQRCPDAEISIIFSDGNKKHCDNLSTHLRLMDLPWKIKVLGPFCERFDSMKANLMHDFRKISAPKFFFLDPFTYSEIEINDIKELMELPAAEVLLFLPTFHSYRFVKCSDDVGALKKFLDKFTEKGCADYADINDFNEAIRQKLLSATGLKFVRAVGLDDGSKKNALFYLTKHITGMLIMNNLVWKYAADGVAVRAKQDPGLALFDLSPLSENYAKRKELFENFIREKKVLNNIEIIDFVAQNCFSTKHANDILKEMRKQNLIEVKYNKIDKVRGFYVADNHWDENLATITFRG